MTWKDVEFIFNRALQYSFSRKKFWFLFPILAFCGLIAVFCRTLAVCSGEWVSMSLTFLPMFVSTAVLIAAGIIIIRIYHHEVKGLPISVRKIVRDSGGIMLEISSLAIPLVLTYLALWITLGFFYLMKMIPGVGMILKVILSFGPFLLVLGLLLLSLLSLAMLFFVTPVAAFQSKFNTIFEWKQKFYENAFTHSALFLLGLFPVAAVVGLLSLAAVIAGTSYVEATRTLSIGFTWFFIMLPFSAMLTPAALFFFNFSAECYVYVQRKLKT